MFTGIIQKISKVEKVSSKNGSLFVIIQKPKSWKVWKGESIAINGVCSTIKSLIKNSFEVEYMPETIDKTTVGDFKKGSIVNLEKSLKLSDLVDGHLVQGHIDFNAKVQSINAKGQSKILKVSAPEKFMKLIAEKGSVAIDGISLTVVDTGKNWFTASLVSYTLDNTNLGKIRVGDRVNVETDVIAKYVAKIMSNR